MLETPRILAFAGSLRSGSWNKMLSKIGAEAAREAGAEVTWIDLSDFPLPVFNEDDETARGLPENAKKLKQLFVAHEGLFIATPEYNSSIPGGLKNVIDWVSRREGEAEPPKVAFQGKSAALVSASPGGFGGMRSLRHLRTILGSMGVFLLPDEISIASADEAFDAGGQLKDGRKQQQVGDLARRLVEVTRKLG